MGLRSQIPGGFCKIFSLLFQEQKCTEFIYKKQSHRNKHVRKSLCALSPGGSSMLTIQNIMICY